MMRKHIINLYLDCDSSLAKCASFIYPDFLCMIIKKELNGNLTR